MIDFGVHIRIDGDKYVASCQRLGIEISNSSRYVAFRQARDLMILTLRKALAEIQDMTMEDEMAAIDMPCFFDDEKPPEDYGADNLSAADFIDDKDLPNVSKKKTGVRRTSEEMELIREWICKYVKEHDEGVTAEDIVALKMLNLKEAYGLLARMTKAGNLQRAGRGIYVSP